MRKVKTTLLTAVVAFVLSCGGGGSGGGDPGALYFIADTGGGRSLWSYDIQTGAITSSLGMTISSQGLFLYDGKIHFEEGGSLWNYDLASSVSTIVSDAYPWDERAAVYRDRLFFRYNDGVRGMELWSYEASSRSSTIVEDINPVGSDGSGVDFLTVYDDRLFFMAFRDDVGEELWYYDASAGAVTLAADINPSPGQGSGVDGLMVYDDRLFFSAYSSPNNRELWAYDSASEAATLVIDLDPSGGSSPYSLTTDGEDLYFIADDGTSGSELWSYSAASDMATQLTLLNPAAGQGISANQVAIYAGQVFFDARTSSNYNLWSCDPDTGSTSLVFEGSLSSNGPMTVYGGDMFFWGELRGDSRGAELWTLSAPSFAPTMLVDFNPSGDGDPWYFLVVP